MIWWKTSTEHWELWLLSTLSNMETDWDKHLPHLLFAYQTKPHESTRESSFFLLYGQDACIPCESVLSTKQTPYQVDIDDYKSELMFSLAESWQVAWDHIKKSQCKQKKSYNKRAKTRAIRVGDRVMVLMPQEQTGKNQKLHRPYFGPYRVLYRSSPKRCNRGYSRSSPGSLNPCKSVPSDLVLSRTPRRVMDGQEEGQRT